MRDCSLEYKFYFEITSQHLDNFLMIKDIFLSVNLIFIALLSFKNKILKLNFVNFIRDDKEI